ncbi:MAG: hypothetical protein HY935_06600 [Nitrosomonadales bacterium]|nr:hypothetical protein [Nitrosomonadales bacterium]
MSNRAPSLGIPQRSSWDEIWIYRVALYKWLYQEIYTPNALSATAATQTTTVIPLDTSLALLAAFSKVMEQKPVEFVQQGGSICRKA